MLEISNQNTKVQSPQFKANGGQVQAAPPMPLPPMSPDTFELMQAKKKADSKDNWMKAGVIAGVGCAVAFGIQALVALATHKVNKSVAIERKNMLKEQAAYYKRNGKEQAAEAVKNIYEDISKATKIEDMALSEDLKKLVEY